MSPPTAPRQKEIDTLVQAARDRDLPALVAQLHAMQRDACLNAVDGDHSVTGLSALTTAVSRLSTLDLLMAQVLLVTGASPKWPGPVTTAHTRALEVGNKDALQMFDQWERLRGAVPDCIGKTLLLQGDREVRRWYDEHFDSEGSRRPGPAVGDEPSSSKEEEPSRSAQTTATSSHSHQAYSRSTASYDASPPPNGPSSFAGPSTLKQRSPPNSLPTSTSTSNSLPTSTSTSNDRKDSFPRRLYFGNLYKGISRQTIADLCYVFIKGDIEDIQLKTGEQSDFAFVSFSLASDAHQAVARLDNYSLRGWAIHVEPPINPDEKVWPFRVVLSCLPYRATITDIQNFIEEEVNGSWGLCLSSDRFQAFFNVQSEAKLYRTDRELNGVTWRGAVIRAEEARPPRGRESEHSGRRRSPAQGSHREKGEILSRRSFSPSSDRNSNARQDDHSLPRVTETGGAFPETYPQSAYHPTVSLPPQLDATQKLHTARTDGDASSSLRSPLSTPPWPFFNRTASVSVTFGYLSSSEATYALSQPSPFAHDHTMRERYESWLKSQIGIDNSHYLDMLDQITASNKANEEHVKAAREATGTS